jgi:hypothetical protein
MLPLHKLLCNAGSSLKSFLLFSSSVYRVFHDVLSYLHGVTPEVIPSGKLHINRSTILVGYIPEGRCSM